MYRYQQCLWHVERDVQGFFKLVVLLELFSINLCVSYFYSMLYSNWLNPSVLVKYYNIEHGMNKFK